MFEFVLWLGVGYTPGASSSKHLGSHHWGKRIIGIVPLTGIQQQGAAFGIFPSDLFRSAWCRCCYTWLIHMIWCIYVCCALLICYYELFRYLDYCLIMISVWEAWPRLVILWYCRYIVIDYDWLIGIVPSDLFRSALCRDGVSILMRVIFRVGPVGIVQFGLVPLMYSVIWCDFSYWAIAHSFMFKCR